MTTIKAFITRHPVPTYFALTFAISWGGVLLVIGGPGGIPGTQEQFETLLPLAILAMLAGPSVAGGLLTSLVYERAGLRELLSRLLRWRVGARWYAVALLTAPLLFTAVRLPAYRVLMVWVYDRTGSLLVAMLMHASFAACTFILGPLAISGVALLTYDVVSAVAWWVVVAAVAVATGGQLSRQPLLRRAA